MSEQKNNQQIKVFENNRILIIDDNDNIHNDFKKILIEPLHTHDELDKLEAVIFEKDANAVDSSQQRVQVEYKIDHALCGEEGLQRVQWASRQELPYALIFVDVRMPPGMDGIEAAGKIWEIAPATEIVLCTAFSDYTWENIVAALGPLGQLLFLKKPFNSVEVKQMCYALLYKWNQTDQLEKRIRELEGQVAESNG